MDISTNTKGAFTLGQVNKPGARTVSVYITTKTNLENTAKNNCLGLMYTDLLSSGCGSLSRDDFQFKLSELGSTISVSVSEGKFTVHLSALKTKLKPTLALLELMLTTPSFKAVEHKRASLTLKNALEQSKENSKGIALSGLKNSFFDETNQLYDYSADELIKSVDSCTVADLKKIHTLTMESPWTMTVGGDSGAIDTTFKSLNKIKVTSKEPAGFNETSFTGLKGTQVVTKEIKSKQNIDFSIGSYLPLTLQDSELPAFLFGLNVLGKWGGFSGRLMSTVREKEGLTYGIYAHAQGITIEQAGYWRIMTFFSPKDTIKAINSTLREIKLIQNKGITDKELERFKTILKTGDALILDSLNGTTALVHNRLVAGQNWDEYKLFREKLYTCTKKDVNSALKEYLSFENITISAAGPIAGIEKELKEFAK